MFLRIYGHNGEIMKLYATAVFAVSTIDIRGLRKYSDNGIKNIKLDRIFFTASAVYVRVLPLNV